jgi:hypothetical protein
MRKPRPLTVSVPIYDRNIRERTLAYEQALQERIRERDS